MVWNLDLKSWLNMVFLYLGLFGSRCWEDHDRKNPGGVVESTTIGGQCQHHLRWKLGRRKDLLIGASKSETIKVQDFPEYTKYFCI